MHVVFADGGCRGGAEGSCCSLPGRALGRGSVSVCVAEVTLVVLECTGW